MASIRMKRDETVEQYQKRKYDYFNKKSTTEELASDLARGDQRVVDAVMWYVNFPGGHPHERKKRDEGEDD